MSDFQTMDDFAVFVNDYLTPDQLSVQAYSYASDQQELSLLVTIDFSHYANFIVDFHFISLKCVFR